MDVNKISRRFPRMSLAEQRLFDLALAKVPGDENHLALAKRIIGGFKAVRHARQLRKMAGMTNKP